jgi:transcriptional antiterminator Rof (Rho-off)
MKFSATILTIGDEVRRNASSLSNQKNEEMSDITSIYTYMLGRFNKITSLSHPNLCKNLELIKCLTG